MSFPRYGKHKDSGVEWLGQVPEHWNVRRLGAIFRQADEEGEDDLEILSVSIHDGVSDKELDENEMDRKVTRSDDRSKYKKVQPGDLVYNMMRAWQGGFGSVAVPGMVSPAYVVARPISDFSTPFIEQLLRTPQAIEQMRRYSQGVTDFRLRLYWEEFKAISVALPPRDEQTIIARFLDGETAKIDALVGEQRRLIELLKEKRQAVISHAVTKGLNPHAPMKPSGIEWLGEVPEHWQYGPLRRFWEVVDCKHVTVPFLEEGYPVASVMEVRTFDLDLSQVLRTSEEFYNLLISGDRQPLRGDVIYCRNTANTGTSAYVGTDEPIAMGQDVSLIKSRQHNGRYLNYILHGDTMKQQLETMMVGSTFKRINVADIKALIVICPPRKEQDEIVDYIESKTVQFDTLTADAQRAIELLQERRTALISAAVTGKIDVRGLAESEAA